MAPAQTADGPPFDRIGIVGLGLVGGSVALAVRARWPRVRLVGLDEAEILATARTLGAIDEGAQTLEDLGACDLVLLAAPVRAIVEAITHAGRLGWTMVVTDVGSTKRAIVQVAADAGLTGFVGGHPMAGKESSGLAHAEATLFAGRPWFLDAGRSGSAAYGQVAALVDRLGARVVPIDATAHDRTMAYVSHLPQWIATNLMARAGAAVGSEGLACAGRGFDDVTRLADSPASVWEDVFATNADFVAEAASAFARDVGAAGLDLADPRAIRERFSAARRWREDFVRTRAAGPGR